MPHRFLSASAAPPASPCPRGSLRRRLVFLPRTAADRDACRAMEQPSPTRARSSSAGGPFYRLRSAPPPGRWSRSSEFIARTRGARPGLRAQALHHPQAGGHAVRDSEIGQRKYFYLPSLSANTRLQGHASADQIEGMFPDVTDPLRNRRWPCAPAVLHEHAPSWPLAHPYRYIAHNGEINTLRSSIRWMRALSRSALRCSATISRRSCRSWSGGSDSAVFDNA